MKTNEELLFELIGDSSSKLRETYISKNSPEIYDSIIDFSKDLELTFVQRVWHWVNNVKEIPTCYCGNITKFNKNWKLGYKKYCSQKCSSNSDETKNKRKATNIDRYGVDNVSKSDIIKEKIEKTNVERYGSKSSFQNEKVKEKWKTTINDKYGVNHYFKTEEFKEKRNKTISEKYDVEHYTQSDGYKEKVKLTNNEKYGVDYFTQSDEYKEKVKLTNNEKYGVDHFTQSDEYKEKVKLTNNEKYGVDFYIQSLDFKYKSEETIYDRYGVEHYTKSKEYKEYINSDEYKNLKLKERLNFYKKRGFLFISSNDNLVNLKGECGHEFVIHPTNLQRRMLANIEVCTICNPINSSKSGQELNLLNYIKDIYIGEIKSNTRSVINSFELDIYLPELKLAVEYNGLYWHGELNKDKNYHYNKFKACEEKGIDLIQIWEDDWIYKQEIVKSIIKNRIGIIKNKIYARKCIIKVIEDRERVYNFFNKNHIQGKTNYSIAIGLYDNNELISCMLFLKNELVRFANIIDYNVIGSASKLFKYYTNNYDFNEIVSFADRSVFTGNLYKNLGFEFVHKTKHNFWWVVQGIRLHRFSYNKKKLINMGGNPNLTEWQIMLEMGNYRIFGCGLDKYVYFKKKL